MSADYRFPVILQNGKRLGLRHHIAQYSGYSGLIINRFIDSGDIASHLINYQIYIDIDEALTVLSKSRYHPKRSASAASKILSKKQKSDLFV